MAYTSHNRRKYYLKCHLIFVCKYRLRLITEEVRLTLLYEFARIAEESKFSIDIMEADKDHIHFLISYAPDVAVSQIVRRMKQNSTHALWQKHRDFLRKHLWREHTFWSDGYFVCSIGEANPDTVRRYIENQG